MTLKFRPHHFLCTLGFEGKGYSDAFVENYQIISDRLRVEPNGDQVKITVLSQTDDICSPCPNKRDTICTQEDKIQLLDHNHMAALKWKDGETLTWGEAKARIKTNMSLETFHRICAPCSWRSLGVCEKALKNLIGILFLVVISQNGSAAGDEAKKIASAELQYSKKKYSAIIGQAASLHKLDKFADFGSYYLGLAYRNNKQLELAEKEFQKIIIDYPASSLHKIAEIELSMTELERAKKVLKTKAKARLLFERAFSRLSHLNELFRVDTKSLTSYTKICDESCNPWFVRLAQQFPKASMEAEALDDYYDLKSKISHAFYTRTTQTYKSPDADQAAFDQALFLFLGNEKKKAKDAFASFLEQFPKSQLRHRVRYLLGKLAIQDNQAALAHEAFEKVLKDAPLTYYGLASAFELSIPVEQLFSAEIPELTPTDSNLSPHEIIRINRAETLLKFHAVQSAGIETKELKPREPFSSGLLFYLADLESRSENYSIAFQDLNELLQRGDSRIYTSYTLHMVFPTPYWKEIQEISEPLELDPILVLSLSKQESAFDRTAVSGSGAMGMMQLMPFTAIDVDPNLSRLDLFDATKNIKTGATYLKRLISKYKGNWAKALAAYNSGPGAVDRWVREGKADKDLSYFIESIPFKETQGYVAAIARNYYWYSSRINSDKPSGFQKFWVTQAEAKK